MDVAALHKISDTIFCRSSSSCLLCPFRRDRFNDQKMMRRRRILSRVVKEAEEVEAEHKLMMMELRNAELLALKSDGEEDKKEKDEWRARMKRKRKEEEEREFKRKRDCLLAYMESLDQEEEQRKRIKSIQSLIASFPVEAEAEADDEDEDKEVEEYEELEYHYGEEEEEEEEDILEIYD